MPQKPKKPIKLAPKTTSKKEAVTAKVELSAATPIPFEGGSMFSYVQMAKYLPFLSPSNNYAQTLLEARLLSVTHNACVTTKKDYCAGSGFQKKDGGELSKSMRAWLKSLNLDDQSVTTINQKIFEDKFTYGNVPIELVRYTVGNKRHLSVYVHNLLEWRLGEPDENDRVHYAIQSKLFNKTQVVWTDKDYEMARKLPLYNSRNKDTSKPEPTKGYNWVKDEYGSERTLIWYKQDTTGFKHYGLPSAVSALIYEVLEFKGARFNLDNFDNNMVVSAILTLKGSVTQGEANRVAKETIKTHTGDGKRGRVMVVASEQGVDGSDLHNLDTHKEGSFKDSDILWSEKIILANQWDAILAGIISPSSLGKGSAYLTKLLEIKKLTVIKPAQDDLMEKVWSKIFAVAKKWLNFSDDIENIEIASHLDISGLTDVDITPVVTVDEVRQARGMTKLPDKKKGSMLLGELGNEQKKGVYVKDTKNSNSGN